ncbi:MAG: glycerol-3-phosphate acyltransferase [Actinobacteria bacterium]|nr:MAG: glycerol-3-phosphate acyltransferase [Actinomycetota bacterium]
MTMQHVAVLGTGAWGTTFAQILANNGKTVIMWGRNSETVDFINSHENSQYLPGIELPESLTATTDLSSAVKGADLVAVAVPVAAIRSVLGQAQPYLSKNVVIVSLSKGLELETHQTVHSIIKEATAVPLERIAVLSGPNLSREIAEHHPTATVVACEDVQCAAKIAKACHNSYFRPYVSTDVVGCEIAGATKNVIAVAIGAAEGLGFGANTRSTLITRGLAEMTRLGHQRGGRPSTFAGLAGIGDLAATCSSRLSRNYSFGYRLGQGATLEEALSMSPGVVEGMHSARPILELARSVDVDMPITEGVVQVIHEGATVEEMGESLLSRPVKMDGWKIELV